MKKMYLKILLLSLSLYTGTVMAQVKIAGGATTPLPNASSQLDVEATDRGILIPRLPLTSSTDATTITNGNVESLLVYNTATVADVTPGYHYWDGARWQRLALNSDITPETITTLVANSDGTYTYVSEDSATLLNLVSDMYTYGDTIMYNPKVVNEVITMIDDYETVTSCVQDDATGDATYKNEDGTTSIIDVVSTDPDNAIDVGTDGGAYYKSPLRRFYRKYGVTHANTLGPIPNASTFEVVQVQNCFVSHVWARVYVLGDRLYILDQKTGGGGNTLVSGFTGSGTPTIKLVSNGGCVSGSSSTAGVTYTISISGGILSYSCSSEPWNGGISITGVW